MIKVFFGITGTLLMLAGTPSLAQDSAADGKAPESAKAEHVSHGANTDTDIEVSGKSSDANRMICQREKVTGSRVKSRKVCMTAAQWESSRQESRRDIERVQASRYKSE